MDTRFELRFASGERAGERVALQPGRHVIGRGPGSALRLAHASVSAAHARLEVEDDGVRVVDLESTNGTRVGGRRVESARLAHGDRLHVGNVELVLVDRRFEEQLAAPDDASAARTPPPAPARRPWALFALALLALVAFALVRQRTRARAEPGLSPRAPQAVPGDLLAGGSFEDEDAPAWEAPASVPRALRRGEQHARSGAAGLGVELGPQEWSLVRSPAFALRGARALRLRVALRVRASTPEGAAPDPASLPGPARVGIERQAADGRRLITWSMPAASAPDFQELELVVPIAPGWEEARVVAAARGPGAFALDDASVVAVPPPAPRARFLEDELLGAGERPSALSVVRGGRTVLELALAGWGQDGLRGPGTGWLEAETLDDGFRVSARGCGAGAALALLLRASGEEPWAATLGAAGFRAHAGELAVEGASDLILGAGVEALRVRLDPPRALRGDLAGASLRAQAPFEDGSSLRVQLRFRGELAEAELLREQALAAEGRDDPAAALSAWDELLARVPLRGALVREAQAASARLVSAGLQEVEEVRRELERARFFGLPALLRETLQRARALAGAYRGTDVQPIADGLAGALEAELATWERARAGERAGRLEALLGSRALAGSPALAGRVREELERLRAAGAGGG